MSQSASSPPKPSEHDLIVRIVAGERQLLHDLVFPYERAVYLTAFSILRNHADAEEAAQETMIKVLTHLPQLEDPLRFKGWLLRIALNEARLKRRSRRDGTTESLDQPIATEEDFIPRDFADWREIPSEVVERAEVRMAIDRALMGVPEIYREIFVLRDVEGLSVAECGEVLGLSTSAVKVRLHRARLMLRERLAPVFKKRWYSGWVPCKGMNPW